VGLSLRGGSEKLEKGAVRESTYLAVGQCISNQHSPEEKEDATT